MALELYQAEGCPHCAKVRRFCTRNGISLTLHNPRTAGTPFTSGTVTDRERYDELVEHGKDQVPLLVDTARDVALYESDDIIAYLAEHYTDGEAPGPLETLLTGGLRRFAVGVLLFTGALASADVLTGMDLLNPSLAGLGAASAVILAASYMGRGLRAW